LNQFVVIPRSEENSSELTYFEPRIVKILKGKSITWINRDTKVHSLTSGDANSSLTTEFVKTGRMLPGESATIKIETFQQSIPYFCSIHPSERGIIVILQKEGDKVTSLENSGTLNPSEFSIIEAKNQKILTRLQRQVDPTIVEYLSNPNAELIQNKIMTIVFWDISNFSKLSDKLKDHPELIAVFLNEYFGIAIPVIHEYGGIVDKFIGDGILAYFGFFESDDDPSVGANKALLAALKLKSSFQTLKQNWKETWKAIFNSEINIDIKCGINTGPVLVGLMGSGERDQFTVIGLHVNLASRLEGIANSDQIVISPFTMKEVNSNFQLKTMQIQNGKIKSFEDIREYYIVLASITANKKIKS